MQLGSLFFSVGFKSTGTEAARQMTAVSSQLADTSDRVVEIMEQLADTLQKIAIKIGAVTVEEIKQLEAQRALTKQTEQQSDGFDKLGDATERSHGLYRVMFDKLKDSVGTLNAVRLQILGVAAGMTYMAERSAQLGANLLRFTQLTGLSAQRLQGLQQQAESAGISADDVTEAIKTLQRTSVSISLGEGDGKAFQLLGLAPGQDPFAMLQQLQHAAKTLPPSMFTKLAEDAGLSENVIGMLHDMKNLPPPDKNLIFSDEEIKNLKAFDIFFNTSVNKFEIAMKKLGASVSPFVTPLLTGLDRWAWAISRISNLITNASTGMKAFAVIMSSVAAAVFAAFFPLTALFTGLILLVDDFLAYMRGDESYIGDFLKLFSRFIESIGAQFAKLKEDFKGFALFDVLKDIVKLMTMINPALLGANLAYSAITGPTAAPGAAGNTVQNNNVQIQVDGSKSPTDTANEIKRHLQKQNANGFFQQSVGSY